MQAKLLNGVFLHKKMILLYYYLIEKIFDRKKEAAVKKRQPLMITLQYRFLLWRCLNQG